MGGLPRPGVGVAPEIIVPNPGKVVLPSSTALIATRTLQACRGPKRLAENPFFSPESISLTDPSQSRNRTAKWLAKNERWEVNLESSLQNSI